MRRPRPPVVLLLAAALGGCATYRPMPLGAAPAVPGPMAALPSHPLDDDAIAAIAVVNNPDLRAQRARAGVADAQVFAARLLPDPTISLGVGTVLSGPDPFLDLAGALGLDLAFLRTRGARLAQARGQARQVRLDLAWSEWQTAGQARIRAARVLGLERASALAEASRDATRSLLARTQGAVGRGDLGGDAAQASRAAFSDAETRARVAARDLAAARGGGGGGGGLPAAAPLRVAPRPFPDAPPDAGRLFRLALANRTDLRALEAGYAAQEAAVRLAVLNQFPTLALNVNTARDTAGNLIAGPAVDFTLPLWNRNRGGIAVETATRAALKAEYEARVAQTRAEIAAALLGIAAARRQRDAVLRDLPAARTYAAAVRRAAGRGDLARSAAETAEQALRDREATLAQTAQDAAEQTIALELLTGTRREGWK